MNETPDRTNESKIRRLQDRIFKQMAGEIEAWGPERKQAVNDHILASLAGEPTDDSVFPNPSHYGEFCFRVNEVIGALFDLERLPHDIEAVPIKGLNLSPSAQLKMLWGLHLDMIYMFQEKLLKLHNSSVPLAIRVADFFELRSKKQKDDFRARFLSPLKPIIDQRNLWIHDQPIADKRLERLTSLELWKTITQRGEKKSERSNPILREHRKLLKELKGEFAKACLVNWLVCIGVADGVVDYILQSIVLPFSLDS